MAGDKPSFLLEFLLRQPIPDDLLKELLFRLSNPSSFENPRVKKALFLRQLSSDHSDNAYAEKTLTVLEQIEQIDRSAGPTASYEALKAAYAAVAAELTAGSNSGDFESTVERIWGRRVGDLEGSEGIGLVGRGLKRWKRLFEGAVRDDRLAARIVKKKIGDEAAKAVGNYLKLAFQEMGPPVLEQLASRLVEERVLDEPAQLGMAVPIVTGERSGISDKGVCAPIESGERPGISDKGVTVPLEIGEKSGISDKGVGVPIEIGERSGICDQEVTIRIEIGERSGKKIRHQQLPSSEVSLIKTEERSEINDKGANVLIETEERSEISDKCKKTGYELLPKEVEVVKELLKLSCADLERAVRDPLPEALQKASEIQALEMEKHASVFPPSAKNHDQETSARAMNKDEQEGRQNAAEAPRPSLLERNPTAHTVEWSEESEELITEKTTYSSRRLRLPSPRVGRVSPLKRHDDVKFARRRKNKKWTAEEEEALRKAVEKYGSGQWKLILQLHPQVFEERTEVDLKDKWRNMCRYRR